MFPYPLLCICCSIDFKDTSVLNIFLDFGCFFCNSKQIHLCFEIAVLVAVS